MKITISTPRGLIAGFNSQHGVVQVAGAPGYEKEFASVKAAQRFIDRYADIGYGLERATATIVTEEC